jgi:hypothetical protein
MINLLGETTYDEWDETVYDNLYNGIQSMDAYTKEHILTNELTKSLLFQLLKQSS